jgi:hypothetical protein
VLEQVLETRHSRGIDYAADDALDILARIEHAEGRDEQAIALLAAADSVRQRVHIPLWEPVRERHERLLRELREEVGPAAFDAARTRGATVDIDDVQELARILSDESGVRQQ